LQPLFEFSGACAGCGETPDVKLLTQMFGDRMLVANATGCSSIYGGNLPTTPYCTDRAGRGPAWCNSLFEDNAEFGAGFRMSVDQHAQYARELLVLLTPEVGATLAQEILTADMSSEAGLQAQRGRVVELKKQLAKISGKPQAAWLLQLADYLVKKSVWILGGDGWAYDIGYGGLDHVMAMGKNVNILVMDTEVYSNTGGQASKSTPMGAAAKFAANGKNMPKKDLALIAMSYGYVYVAKVAFGAKDAQTVKAFQEAESYDGPSLILAYSHCIAHGYDLKQGCEQQRLAVDSGHWPLFRYDPRRLEAGENPLQLDSAIGKTLLSQYVKNETRYRMVEQMNKERFDGMIARSQKEVVRRFAMYQDMAKATYATLAKAAAAPATPVATAAPVTAVTPVAPVKPADAH
jgi:pyruvate-ferredoxin/flavodoxin oxidoreductase